MPASQIFITILVFTLVALTLFAAYQINVREQLIAELEAEQAHTAAELRSLSAHHERLYRRYRTLHERSLDAEERVLSRNIFDELADEYAWLQFPDEPGTAVYYYVAPVAAELYDAALNSHEVK